MSMEQGKTFSISVESSSVAAAGTYAISLEVPTDKYVKLKSLKLSSTANVGEIKFYEGSIFTGGTATLPVNQDRKSSAKNSGVAVKYGVTPTHTNGTLLFSNTVALGGTPAEMLVGELGLKDNKIYILQFENIGASTATVLYVNAEWEEI
jgi:hypothetical protein